MKKRYQSLFAILSVYRSHFVVLLVKCIFLFPREKLIQIQFLHGKRKSQFEISELAKCSRCAIQSAIKRFDEKPWPWYARTCNLSVSVLRLPSLLRVYWNNMRRLLVLVPRDRLSKRVFRIAKSENCCVHGNKRKRIAWDGGLEACWWSDKSNPQVNFYTSIYIMLGVSIKLLWKYWPNSVNIFC